MNVIETDTKIQINSNTTIGSQEICEYWSLIPRIQEPWSLPTNPLSKLPNANLSLCIIIYNANSFSYIEVMQITVINI